MMSPKPPWFPMNSTNRIIHPDAAASVWSAGREWDLDFGGPAHAQAADTFADHRQHAIRRRRTHDDRSTSCGFLWQNEVTGEGGTCGNDNHVSGLRGIQRTLQIAIGVHCEGVGGCGVACPGQQQHGKKRKGQHPAAAPVAKSGVNDCHDGAPLLNGR